jgi:pimeloyl-ACP methyl ester carboxylesterase
VSTEGFTPSVDGSPLYYRVIGAGEPTVLLCDGVGCSGYAWRYLIEYLRDRYRIVHWHYRGHGLSGQPRDLARLEISDYAEDGLLVLDKVGASSAVLVGHSMGVQIILEMYRRAPARVRGLIPICGSYGHVLDTFHGTHLLKRIFPTIYRFAAGPWTKPLLQAFWSLTVPTQLAFGIAKIVEINPRLVRADDFLPYLEQMGAMDVEVFVRSLAGASRHTAEDLLEGIRVPTLVVAAEHDGFTPSYLSEKMHRKIPHSELLFLSGGTHTAPIEHEELLNLRIEKFLLDHFASAKERIGSRAAG